LLLGDGLMFIYSMFFKYHTIIEDESKTQFFELEDEGPAVGGGAFNFSMK
jgi:hypothetical protein